jgi:hypothetical protein
VVALVAGALALAAFECVHVLGLRSEGSERFLLGYRLEGAAARMTAVVNAAVCVVLAGGLWTTRVWARLAAMAYLGFMIGSFLVWGVRGSSRDLATIMLWQMFVLPFLTFALMYLQRGGRFFKR